MNITQQSETKLIIKEDTRVLGIFIAVMGFFTSWLIIFFVYTISGGNDKPLIETTIGIISILLLLILLYFYNMYRITVLSFDKESNKFTVSTTTILSKKQLEYSLKEITKIVSKPITINNSAWGIQGMIWYKLYGDQRVIEGIYYMIVIKFLDGKEYVLKPNASSLYSSNSKNQFPNIGQVIASFLNIQLLQETLPKPILPFSNYT